MDPRFYPHNSHLEDSNRFAELDPQLRRLAGQPLVHRSPLIDQLPTTVPGIYTLGGGRQIGKTTLLKQWMASLLAAGTDPRRIFFLTGELLDDHHALRVAMQAHLAAMPPGAVRFLLLDEVTYIREWDKAVKFLADAGFLDDVVLVLTGSDLALVRDARLRLPGRRGRADRVDLHLHPLTFGASVALHGEIDDINALVDPTTPVPEHAVRRLHHALNAYLRHGGFLTAINDVAREGRVAPATLRIYADWLRGDVSKRGRQELYLREVLASLCRRLGSQLTWNALARDVSIDHPRTVQEYVELLAMLDALFVQPALLEDKLAPAPKKARKICFSDPFIFHAVRSWLQPVDDPWSQQVQPATDDPELSSRLVEAVVAAHFRRFHDTYYIKAAGEVDVAVVQDGRFRPIEVKWRGRLRRSDLKQVRRYENGVVFAPVSRPGVVDGVPVEPLALALLRIDDAGRRVSAL